MKTVNSMGVTLAILFITAHAPLHASSMDERIESAARNSYAFKQYLKADRINVHSKDGAVVLTGAVANKYHDALANETVANLPGVKTVWDSLKVSGNSPVEYSDEWILVKVETALLFHRNVSAQNTRVSVKDGIVTLRGKADNLAQKDLTSEYVADVEGAKEVKNEMTFASGEPSLTKKTMEKIDDASITAQVKVSLLLRRSTSALNTHVHTVRGVVNLSGKAGNAAEKDLVTKLASDINGVKRVVNDMTVTAK